jgi:hypothetical protein
MLELFMTILFYYFFGKKIQNLNRATDKEEKQKIM